jgi:hypothetical protein
MPIPSLTRTYVGTRHREDETMKVLDSTIDIGPISVRIDPDFSAKAEHVVDPELIERLKGKRFSQAPVLSEQGDAIGTISLENLVACHASGATIRLESDKVDTTMLPSTPTVEELLACFSLKRCTLVRGEDASGKPPASLLTISDLNKPPLRHFIYTVLFKLETDLAYLIADTIPDPKEWIPLLPEGSQVNILGNWEIQKRDDIELAVGPLFSCTINDLRHIVLNHKGIRARLDYKDRKEVNEDLYRIIDMRNKVMHPVRPLVSNPTSVERLLSACKGADRVLARIEAAIPAEIEHRLRAKGT